ncbi:MAG: hypothetical protein CMJ76_00850 [Planctomycetaceae bacterium]|nr:hypothetical protein [Planctomycetaceae bacterium]|tara:strand:- start:455 stop:817 length:363 start_codon:yes stop_codon:yes gene_type:complete
MHFVDQSVTNFSGHLRSIHVNDNLCTLSFKLASEFGAHTFFVITLRQHPNRRKKGTVSGFSRNLATPGSSKVKLNGAFSRRGENLRVYASGVNDSFGMTLSHIDLDLDSLAIDSQAYHLT